MYQILHKKGIVSFPPTKESEGKIDALIANINGSVFGVPSYFSLEEKASAYLYFLIKNHPFIDGNKRTAVLAFEVFCELNNLRPTYRNLLEEVAVYIEKTRSKDYREIINILTEVLFNKS